MRFKNRKWASPFFIVSLAVAGLFGASAGIVKNHNGDNNNFEKASATYDGTVYYAVDTATVSNGNKIKVEWNNRGNNEAEWKQQVEMTRQSDFYKDGWVIYKAVIPTQYNGVGWLQFQLYNSNDQWQWNDMRVTKQYNWTELAYINNKVCVCSTSRNWEDIYFYTLRPNGGQGSITNQVKLSGESSTLVTCDTVGIYPGGGRHFVKWSTTSSGQGGTDYQPGASLENNNKTLYLIQDWYTYQYSTDSGTTWIDLTRNDSQPSGYVTWFKPNSDKTYVTGQSLSFRRYYGNNTPESISPRYWQGGNYDTTYNKVVYTCTGKLEVKITFEDAHDIYVPGYSQRSIVIDHGGIETRYHLSGSGTDFYTSLEVTLYPGDKITAGFQPDGKPWVQYNPGYFKSGSEGDFTADGGNNPINCYAPGVFTIHLMKSDVTEDFSDVKFVMNASATAKLFAQTFNSDIGSICSGITGGSKTFNDLKNKMGTSESAVNTEYRYYHSLNTDAKNLIVINSGDSDISACVAKYNFILSKYGYGGEGELVDFMGKNPPKRSNALLTPFKLVSGGDDNNISTITIIASSSVALLSITALSVLLVKKRKRKEN